MEGWAGVYKFLRLAVLALALLAIGIWLFRPSRKERLEAPARRMLEDEAPGMQVGVQRREEER